MTNVLVVILGMAAVTYLPRLVPFLFISNKPVPKRLDAFLKCIPAAALGALIIPGVFYSTPEVPMAAILGICFTIIYGLFKGGMIIPVLGSVAATYLVLWLYA